MAAAVSAPPLPLTDDQIFEQEVQKELARLRKLVGAAAPAPTAAVSATPPHWALSSPPRQPQPQPYLERPVAAAAPLYTAPPAAAPALPPPQLGRLPAAATTVAHRPPTPTSADRGALSPAARRAQAESYAEDLRRQMEEAAQARKREREALLSAGPGSVLPVPSLVQQPLHEPGSAGRRHAAAVGAGGPVRAFGLGDLSRGSAGSTPQRVAGGGALASLASVSPPRPPAGGLGLPHSYDIALPSAGGAAARPQLPSVGILPGWASAPPKAAAPVTAAAPPKAAAPVTAAAPPALPAVSQRDAYIARQQQQQQQQQQQHQRFQQQQPTAGAAEPAVPVGAAAAGRPSAAGNLDADTLRAAVAAGASFSRYRARSMPPEERLRAEDRARARERYEAELRAQIDEQAARKRAERSAADEARLYAAGHHLSSAGGGSAVDANGVDGRLASPAGVGRRRVGGVTPDRPPQQPAAYNDAPVEVVYVRGRKVARASLPGGGRRSSDAGGGGCSDYEDGAPLPWLASGAAGGGAAADGDVVGMARGRRQRASSAAPVTGPRQASVSLDVPADAAGRRSSYSGGGGADSIVDDGDAAPAASTLAYRNVGSGGGGGDDALHGDSGMPPAARQPYQLPLVGGALSPPRATGYYASAPTSPPLPSRPNWTAGELRGLSQLAAIASGAPTPHRQLQHPHHPSLPPPSHYYHFDPVAPAAAEVLPPPPAYGSPFLNGLAQQYQLQQQQQQQLLQRDKLAAHGAGGGVLLPHWQQDARVYVPSSPPRRSGSAQPSPPRVPSAAPSAYLSYRNAPAPVEDAAGASVPSTPRLLEVVSSFVPASLPVPQAVSGGDEPIDAVPAPAAAPPPVSPPGSSATGNAAAAADLSLDGVTSLVAHGDADHVDDGGSTTAAPVAARYAADATSEVEARARPVPTLPRTSSRGRAAAIPLAAPPLAAESPSQLLAAAERSAHTPRRQAAAAPVPNTALAAAAVAAHDSPSLREALSRAAGSLLSPAPLAALPADASFASGGVGMASPQGAIDGSTGGGVGEHAGVSRSLVYRDLGASAVEPSYLVAAPESPVTGGGGGGLSDDDDDDSGAYDVDLRRHPPRRRSLTGVPGGLGSSGPADPREDVTSAADEEAQEAAHDAQLAATVAAAMTQPAPAMGAPDDGVEGRRPVVRSMSSTGSGAGGGGHVDISFAEIEQALGDADDYGGGVAEPAAAEGGVDGGDDDAYNAPGDYFEQDEDGGGEEDDVAAARPPPPVVVAGSPALSPLANDSGASPSLGAGGGRRTATAADGITTSSAAGYLGESGHLVVIDDSTSSSLMGHLLADTMKPLPLAAGHHHQHQPQHVPQATHAGAAAPPAPPAGRRPLSIISEEGDAHSATAASTLPSTTGPHEPVPRHHHHQQHHHELTYSLSGGVGGDGLQDVLDSDADGGGAPAYYDGQPEADAAAADASWGLPPAAVAAHKEALLAFYRAHNRGGGGGAAAAESVDAAWQLLGPHAWEELGRRYPGADVGAYEPHFQ